MVGNDTNLVLQARNVSKRFGKKQVLKGTNLDVPRGKIIGITGHNGAGKSVLLRVLSGFIVPDEGEIRIFNQLLGKTVEFAPNCGVLIDSPGFLRRESAKKNLEILAEISGGIREERIREVLTLMGLDADDSRPVSCYSSGMLQRLGLAQAILEDPDLLLLDEPTNMLDVNGQREIYDYLVSLNQAGKTILITSNYPDELKILCDQVLMLQQGKLVPYTLEETTAFELKDIPG
ncbi:MAG: ATP-binding cassette domain-containing protein [Chloroflexi bacterium]|nr:ATP-binding cassette domain-containing protein [Chloroflexota bacterium]